MKKLQQTSLLKLPPISNFKSTIKKSTHFPSEGQENVLEEENDRIQVEKLDQWTARNMNTKRTDKPSRLQNSILYKKESVFGGSIPKKLKTIDLVDSACLMETKMYLLRLDNELKKAEDINYNSMCKNPEYCSGFYENFYSDILKALQRYKKELTTRCQELESDIKKQRIDHIKSMESLHSSIHSYRLNISQTRDTLESKQNEVEKIKATLEQLQSARINVLRQALFVGYDIRQDGLIWIIRELGYVPESQQFPSFLNEKQISFIKSKYQKELEESQKSQGLDAENLGKTSDQIYEIVTRKKKRELSMIRQTDILKQLKMEHNREFKADRHKYLNEDILKMAEELPKTKATKYEIIYKQTLKKLNKYCMGEIYKKNTCKKPKEIIESRKQSLNTLKILSHFQAKIQDYMRKANNEEKQVNDEQKQLDEIIRNLRYEGYQQTCSIEHGRRNAITILGCLLGHRKASRIVEQQLNHLF